MQQQDYAHHARYYTPHHFVFYPIALGLIIFSGRCIFKYPAQSTEWTIITIVLVMITWLSFMTRQHYALTLQNRLVRLELRVRYYQLTGQRLELVAPTLRFSQMAALRFASDTELPELVKRTMAEKLSSDDIKKSVKDWQPDTMRV